MPVTTRSSVLYIFFKVCLTITGFFIIASTVLFLRSHNDPRWRVFDFNSRQAAESEIYNVAEIPSIRSVEFNGRRRLRFAFETLYSAQSWTVTAKNDSKTVYEGEYPEIPFSENPYTDIFTFVPHGVEKSHPIEIAVSFYPGEKYAAAGLSWPDNYYSPSSTIPFDLKKPYSIDEWAGLPDNDPEIIEAKRIIGDAVDKNAPVVERASQVFKFIMTAIKNSGGTPTDALQDASPLETYRMLATGGGKGFCENWALVYYIFANAAGVKTRLIDVAGKFGPLKLTGHYFCESWDPDQRRWFLVDPMSGVAHVTTPTGRLLSTLDSKRLFDTDMIGQCSALYFDRTSDILVERGIGEYDAGNRGYLAGDIVIAYKFGYPKNKSYSSLCNFITRPTLLYAPFSIPKLYRITQVCQYGIPVSIVVSVLVFIAATRRRYRERAERV